MPANIFILGEDPEYFGFIGEPNITKTEFSLDVDYGTVYNFKVSFFLIIWVYWLMKMFYFQIIFKNVYFPC